MSSRVRNLLLAAAVPVVIVAVGWSLLTGGSAKVAEGASDTPAASSPDSSAGSAEGLPENSHSSFGADRRGYALAVPELNGLSEDAAPGTRLELWVAWDPPVTKESRVQRLLADVILEEIIAPVLPEAPATAVLSVPEKRVPDLLWGDRYGSLSVTMLSDD
jgi:hypothetical protein